MWRDNLNVNVPEIDKEHRQLVVHASELNRAIVQCADKSTIKRLLDLMLMEATRNFRHEQQLFEKWKYPDRVAHTLKHAQLSAQIECVMRKFELADVSFTWALKSLHIKQLLLDHLLKEDMKYRDFLEKLNGANMCQDQSEAAPPLLIH